MHAQIGKEFERRAGAGDTGDAGDDDGGDEGEDMESLAPVDVDLNLVKNLLESYSLQQGEAGPVGNLMGQLGISLPDDDKNTKKE
jgi:hypothetical protein